jgi:hypothetical protein
MQHSRHRSSASLRVFVVITLLAAAWVSLIGVVTQHWRDLVLGAILLLTVFPTTS